MNPPKPHFLLLCEGNSSAVEHSTALTERLGNAIAQINRWRFVLENVVTGEKFQATDREVGCTLDRASLIAVLRGLEALEQPSKVTLVTNNRYVFRGLQYGLTEWRENDFSWEHFGAIQPIRNADVWQRIDRTLAFHEVQCRWMAIEDGNDNECLPVSELHTDPTEPSGTDAAQLGPEQILDPEPSRLEADVASEALPCSENAWEEASELNETSKAEWVAVGDASETVEIRTTPRIFKDSVPSRTVIAAERVGSTVVTTVTVNSETLQNVTIKENEGDRLHGSTDSRDGPSLCSKLFYPFALFWSFCKSVLLTFWEAILRLDEGVESYLRCMLLLDPKDRHRRRG